MINRIVIVGAGHAAGQLIASLGQLKFAGKITLIGEESYLPYQRPPLSKKYLSGDVPAERLLFKPPSFYDTENIEIRLNTCVAAIDRDLQTVLTSSGETIAYDALVLALGSRVRQLTVPGSNLPGVHTLRTIDDVDAIRASLERGKHLAIAGAGYIGLEVAAVARQLGQDVTVFEMAERVMSRVVSPEISDFYQIEHTSRGVRLRLATRLKAIHGDSRAERLETSDGELIDVDSVVVGIGIVPNVELAEDAELHVDDGIVVNDRCQCSDPRIYAIGDCTAHPNGVYQRQVRLESVHNALEQAKTAANNLCGQDSHYSDVPWFWSDQYDLKLQIAGLSSGYDRVIIRGTPSERAFSCLYIRDDRLIAIDAVNTPRDFVQAKALIAEQRTIGDLDLANADRTLKDLFGS